MLRASIQHVRVSIRWCQHRRHLGFHPEGFNLASMHVQPGQKGYPLRPEHVESLFWAHRTTRGDEWLHAGADVLRSLERLRVPCGFAAVGDVINGTLENKMEVRKLAPFTPTREP